MKEWILKQDELYLLFSELPQKGIILLRGEVASGKTTLIKAWLNGLDINENVSSPTFSLMHKYQKNGLEIYHYDLYQKGFQGLLERGLFENFFEEGLHLVEWGCEKLEVALKKMNLKPIVLKISNLKNERKYQIYE